MHYGRQPPPTVRACLFWQVFFRAGKLAFLDALTGSEYKELAPDIANKVRVWLIKKRWRRHTIAVVAFLRLKRALDDLRLVARFVSAAHFMTLMANRDKLSLKRARQIRQRNGATAVQRLVRGFVASRRYHKAQWATQLAQRVYRGHMARKRAGPRITEIRMKRKAEEDARAAEREAARKAKEKDDIDRIREMARGGGKPAASGTASRYGAKKPGAKESASNAGGIVVFADESGDFESRFKRMEKVGGRATPSPRLATPRLPLRASASARRPPRPIRASRRARSPQVVLEEVPALQARVKELESQLEGYRKLLGDGAKGVNPQEVVGSPPCLALTLTPPPSHPHALPPLRPCPSRPSCDWRV